MIIFAIFVACGGVVTIAIAQSGGGVFNLNSPVSFPVDI